MSAITPSTPAVVPAGWYPDPAGSPRLRLWSGSSWTSQLETPGPLAQPEYRYLSDGIIVLQQDY
ncbi:hypothetical protein BH10ACT7_BH10ACT7_19580 [soil metagenome]